MEQIRYHPQHIVNISGGKDSTACYLLALRRGQPFRAVMADTGNEHPATIEYAMSLGARTGGPQVEIYRADFAERVARKRAYIAEHWPGDGVPQAIVDRAIAALHPTGIPFLDLCLWKGRFPTRRAQFCTEFLKSEPIAKQVIDPARRAGPVVQWLGVRRDESLNRQHSPMWQTVRTPGMAAMRFYRPLIHWSAGNCFALAAAHGLDPNPLYLQGMTRVAAPTDEEIADGTGWPAGFVHIPKGTTAEWTKQLTAEQLMTIKTRQGFQRLEWQQTRDRNEALDCRVYARAAAWLMGMDRWDDARWEQLREQVNTGRETDTRPAGQPHRQALKPPPPRQSGWLGNRPRGNWF